MAYFTYILASKSGKAIYIGVTNDLRKRVGQHRGGAGSVHTARYNIHRLVYYEIHKKLEQALLQERKLKRWRRSWKNDLIQKHNPYWADLMMEVPL